MRVPECNREHEVFEAITSGKEFDVELDNHVAKCNICNDVVVVTRALFEQHLKGLEDVRVPPAGLVWWRAELRARQEATRVAERPLTLVHAFAGACAIGVALALIVGMLPWLQDWLISFTDLPRLGVLIGAVVALAVVTPVALYFVVSDK